jgi:hypothetical protein
MPGGTGNNKLKGAAKETMAVVKVTVVETATATKTAVETATVTASITMLTLMPTTAHQ